MLNASIYSSVCEPSGVPGAISSIVPNPVTLVVVEQWLLIEFVRQEDGLMYERAPAFRPEQKCVL